MARPRVRNLDFETVESEASNTMFEYRHMVRVLSRGVAGVPPSDPAGGLFSARDVEKELAELSKQGWVMMGQPQFTGMENYMDQQGAGFRMLYFFTREISG